MDRGRLKKMGKKSCFFVYKSGDADVEKKNPDYIFWETPVPTVQPTAVPVQDQSGEFRSDTGTYINIVVKWTVTGSGGTKTLKLDTYVESYALVTGDRTSDVVFTVGGNVSYASSKAIRLDNVPLTQTFLGSTSVDVTSGTDVPVNVTWHFNGTYSNQNIATIVAEDTLHIN